MDQKFMVATVEGSENEVKRLWLSLTFVLHVVSLLFEGIAKPPKVFTNFLRDYQQKVVLGNSNQGECFKEN